MREITSKDLRFLVLKNDDLKHYQPVLEKLVTELYQLPHSEEHKSGFVIQFIVDGEIDDLPNSLAIDIQKWCCYTYKQNLQNHFEKRKEELVNNQPI